VSRFAVAGCYARSNNEISRIPQLGSPSFTAEIEVEVEVEGG
jgi:hypothetical protein